MPKRNVASKVKSMLTASAVAATETPPRAHRRTPGRWDAVLEKIAVGQAAGHKLKPRLKDVKSKVFAATPSPPTALPDAKSGRTPPPARAVTPRATPPTRAASKKRQQVALREGPSPCPAAGAPTAPATATTGSDGATVLPPHGDSRQLRAATQRSGVLPMKTPARKGAPRRPPPPLKAVPTPPRDRYRAAGAVVEVGASPQLQQLASEPTKLVSSRAAAPLAVPCRAAPASQVVQASPAPPASTAPLPPAPPTPLREPWRLCVRRFDALALVLQHALAEVERLEKNERFANYDKIWSEWQNNKLTLEKYKESLVSLEGALLEKANCCSELYLKQEELSKENELIKEEKSKLEQETNEIIAALEKKYHSQVELVHSQYATEQASLRMQFKEREEALWQEFSEKHEENKKQQGALTATLCEDFFLKETRLTSEISQLKEDNERVKKQLSIFVDAESKDSRLQASIGRCGELEEEVRSLQSVLELRHQELQDLRKSNGSLTRQAEQLPGALQRITALEARVEDLQAQLKEKCEVERHTAQQQCALVEALQKEVNQKNRLTLLNEELQWKLKQNSEVFNAIATMNGSSSIQIPNTSGASSPALTRRTPNGSLRSVSDSTSSTKGECDVLSRISVSLMKRVNNGHQTLRADPDDEIASSPPPSPKIKGVVEKNDSVSWVLDLEESSGELVSRLFRRAGSLRGQPTTCGQVSHTQTLPSVKHSRLKSHCLSLSPSSSCAVYRRSASKPEDAEYVKIQSDHFSPSRSRSHSVSGESVNSDNVINWGINLSDSFNNIAENKYDVSSYDKSHMHTVKISGNQGYRKIHKQMDVVLTNNLETELQKHSCENGKPNWNCNLTDFSHGEIPTKSSGSSAYTSSDEDVRNNIDGKTRDVSYNSNEKSCHLPNVLPFNTMNICGSPNTADLSLLAACAAVQPALMPKDAAGEAMVSEETSEDENDHEVDEKDETISSSITRSASENEEEEEGEEEEEEDDDVEEDDEHYINI